MRQYVSLDLDQSRQKALVATLCDHVTRQILFYSFACLALTAGGHCARAVRAALNLRMSP